MPDDRKNDSKLERERTAVLPPNEKEKNESELSEKAEHIKAEERDVKASTTAGTSELKREKLEEEVIGPETETAEMILSLDISKESDEQTDAVNRLELVKCTLLPKLFAAGFKREVLRTLESFRAINVEASVPLNGTEKIALKKLMEIAGHPLSPLFRTLSPKWSDNVDRIHKNYVDSIAARKAMMGETETEDEKPNAIVKFVKDNPITSAVIAAAGAYGVYKIFFEDDSPETAAAAQAGTKESWWKSAKVPAGIGLGLLALGAVIGPERIKNWLEKAFNFSKEKVERFVKLMGEGRYKDAFLSLFEGSDENMENYGKIAERISKETGKKVTDSSIKRIADAKYGMFMIVSGEVKSYAISALKEIPGIGRIAEYLVESEEQLAEEKIVREYLQKHKDEIAKINPGSNATVFQVLAELNNLAVKGPETEKEKEPGVVSEAISTGLGETVGVIEETMADIKAEFKDKPNFSKLMEKYDQKWSSIFFHPFDFIKELFTACKKDGIPLLVGGGKIILVNGYKFVTFTSAKALFNSAISLIEAPFSDEVGWSDGITEYLIGTSPFIVIGAGLGGLFGKDKSLGMRALKGAGRGAILPIEVARLHVKGAQLAYRTARGTSYNIRRHFAAEEMKPKILESEARFYAEVFDGYDRLEMEGEQGRALSPKKWYAKLTSERIAQLKMQYLKKFAGVYKNMEGGTELFTKTEAEIATSTTKLREWIRAQREAGKIKPLAGQPKITPEMEAKMMVPEAVKGKPNVYEFGGQRFNVTPEEIAAKKGGTAMSDADAIRELCMEKAINHLSVEDVRIKNGVHEYKIGGKWIKTENPSSPATLEKIKMVFEEIMKKDGKAVDFAKFAAEAKTLKYFGILEKALGTAAAVGVIVHLEMAEDKRKAIAEVASGFGTFYAGMKLADWQIGNKFKNPLIRTVVDISGGLATAIGLTEPVAQLVSSFYKDKPWAYGASNEVKQIMEKMSVRALSRTVIGSLEKGILRKGLTRIGLEAVGRSFETKVSGLFLKKLAQVAAMQGFKQVLKALGLRGAVTVALLADDATVIGVVDDVIAAGLIIWMGYDAIQIVRLVANANEVNNLMAERNKHKISKFNIKDTKSRAALQEKLTPFGLTVENATELGEQQLFDILRTLPQTVVEITREGAAGKEVWTLNKGEAVGIAILDDGGNILAQVADEDATLMSEALASANSAETKDAA